MIIIYAMLAIIAIAVILGIAWVFYRSEQLDEWEEELDKMTIHLDGRANRIAAEEATLKAQWSALRMAKESIEKEREGQP